MSSQVLFSVKLIPQFLSHTQQNDPDSNLELLKDQTVTSGQETITRNLFELCGMLMTAFVKQVIWQERPETEGDTVLLREGNVVAVSWINRCGGSPDKPPSLA